MTWNNPHPVPQTPHPALVPARPLTLGEIASGAWRVYTARFGLFVKLLLMPFFLVFAASLVFALMVMGVVVADPEGTMPSTGITIVALSAVFYVVLLAISMMVYVYQGRTVIAGLDLATGRADPTSTNLAERTRGMLGRVFVLMLLALALGLVVGLLFILLFFPVVATGATGGGDAAGGAAVVMVLLVPVLYAALIWLAVKLVYVLPAMAEEGLGAIDAIKRSFALTRGAFWRTLGYQLVLALILMALMVIPYLIVAAVSVGAYGFGSDPTPSAGGAIALGFGMLVLYAAMILFVPYQYLYTALMYLSRRRELGATAAGGFGGPGPSQPQPYGSSPTPAYGWPSPADPYGQQQPYPPQQQPYPPQQQYPPQPGQQNPWGPPPAAPGGSSAPQR